LNHYDGINELDAYMQEEEVGLCDKRRF
jgi:hypothetical protein